MARAFRVVWIEDQEINSEALGPVYKTVVELAQRGTGHVEFFSSKDLLSFENELSEDPWRALFLTSADVLLLDLGMACPRAYQIDASTLPEAPQEDIDEINSKYGGAAFYLKERESLQACRAVIILTGFDKNENPGIIGRYLDPYCHDNSAPWTAKFWKSDGVNRVCDIVTSLYQDFALGYVSLEHRGSIEFAASHDEPVLIVGETGTGKEYIARAIHRRWRQEKKRDPRYAQTRIPDDPVVINCPALSSELARAELFGHVKGSFTGAQDHRIGAILSACGCRGFRSQKTSAELSALREEAAKYKELLESLGQYDPASPASHRAEFCGRYLIPLLSELLTPEYGKSVFGFLGRLNKAIAEKLDQGDYVEEFRSGLVRQNETCLERSDNDLAFRDCRSDQNLVRGTLFLDEFGDLSPDVQTLFLRYLESKEVQPVGFPNLIHGADVRIIAATSDPRVAEFAGEKLRGGWRTVTEWERPLREDLLHRVKGWVIRAEAIDESSISRTLDRLVEGRGGPEWTRDAKDFVESEIRETLKAIDQAMMAPPEREDGGKRRSMPPSFGHKRELVRIVTLVNAFMATAEARGIRAVGKRVTREIVERIWRPSRVESAEVDPRGVSPTAMDGTPWTIYEFEQRVDLTPADKQYHILNLFLSHLGHDFQIQEVIDYLDTGKDLAEVRVRYSFKPYKNEHAARSAISKLRDKINAPELIRESGVKLKGRGYGAILTTREECEK